MWRLTKVAVLVSVMLGSGAVALAQQTEAETKAEHGIESITRFEGKVSLRTKKPALRPFSVSIRNWQLHGRQRIEAFPQKGSLTVQLHSGKVKTVINGKESEHNEGDFWSVPAGARMSVEVTSESAFLQIFSLEK